MELLVKHGGLKINKDQVGGGDGTHHQLQMIWVCGPPVVDLTASETVTSSWYNSSSVLSRRLSTNSNSSLHQVQKHSNELNNVK